MDRVALISFLQTPPWDERYLADRMFPDHISRHEAIQGLKTYCRLKWNELKKRDGGNEVKAKGYALKAEYAFRDLVPVARWNHQHPAWLAPHFAQGGHLPLVELTPIPKEGYYVSVDGRQWARFDLGPEGYQAAKDCKATVIESIAAEIVEKLPPVPVQPEPAAPDPHLQAREAETVTLTLSRQDLRMLLGLIETYQYVEPTGDVPEMPGLDGVKEKLQRANEPRSPQQQYRDLLEAISDLRYPDAGPKQRDRIEASIDRKVTEFIQDRQQRTQEQHQPPPAVLAKQPQRGHGMER